MMRTFSYLFRRLFHSGLNWLLAFILLVFLLPSFLIPDLFSDPNSFRVQDSKTRLSDFTFQPPAENFYEIEAELHELQLSYLREDYIQDLSQYLVYLRQERFTLNSSNPEHLPFLAHLNEQERLHLERLNRTHGLTDQEGYYWSRYAPLWAGNLLVGDRTNIWDRQLMDATAWSPIIKEALQTNDPSTIAKARNLEKQLPLTYNGSTTSSKLLFLIQASRFLLVLLPFLTFYLLFGIEDRNLKRKRSSLNGQKIAAAFSYSALALIISRILWYGVLNIRYGDIEGSMFIAPPWAKMGPYASASVLTLRRYLVLLSLIDFAFMFFLLALIGLVYRLIRRWAPSLAIISFLLLLVTNHQPDLSPKSFSLYGALRYLRYTFVPINISNLPPHHHLATLPQSTALNFIALGAICLLAVKILDLCLPYLKAKPSWKPNKS